MARSNMVLVGIVAVAILVSIGASVVIARMSEGQINVNQRIEGTDRSSFTTEVNSNTTPVKANGGLNPQIGAPDNPAPAAPLPPPRDETGSSTESTTTPEGADVSPEESQESE